MPRPRNPAPSGRGSIPAEDRTLARMRERAANLLASATEPLSSSHIAGALLGVRSGSEQACRTLVEPILSGDPRFEPQRAGGWRLCEAAAGFGERAAPRLWSWVVWAFDPTSGSLAGVRIEGGAAVAEDAARTRTMTAAVRRRLARLGRNARWVNASALISQEEGSSRSGRGRSRHEREVWKALYAGRTDGPALSRPPLALSRLAAAALGPPRARNLASLAARLGRPALDLDDPLRQARQGAECLLEILGTAFFASVSTPEEMERVLMRRPPSTDLRGRGFDETFLRALPQVPGTYRFFDREDRLLYVGKSRSLRERVSSYFASRWVADPRTAEWLPRVHRIEIESVGSELEALLREAELIARANPLRNVQRRVHPRRGVETANLLILLPGLRQAARGEIRGVIRAYLVREASIAGRVLLGPRGGGAGTLRARLESLYFSTPSRSGRRSLTQSQQRDRAILASWLARQREKGLPAFDPTDAPSASAAAGLALRYAESLRQGETGVIHRGELPP